MLLDFKDHPKRADAEPRAQLFAARRTSTRLASCGTRPGWWFGSSARSLSVKARRLPKKSGCWGWKTRFDSPDQSQHVLPGAPPLPAVGGRVLDASCEPALEIMNLLEFVDVISVDVGVKICCGCSPGSPIAESGPLQARLPSGPPRAPSTRRSVVWFWGP